MSTNTEQKQTAILEDGARSRGDRSRNVGAHSSLGMSLAGLRGGTSLLLSIISARGGSMSATGTQSTATKEGASLVVGFWGVRYQVKDVRRSISFYTEQLGFKLDQENLPAFGQ